MMAALLDSGVVTLGVDDGTLVLTSESTLGDVYYPDAPDWQWLRPAAAMVHLECPSDVITARVRVEQWDAAPPADERVWSGSEEAETDFPGGALCVASTHDWQLPVVAVPETGRYRVRMSWVFAPAAGPLYSPVGDRTRLLDTPPGHEAELADVDEFCLMQVWPAGI